MDRLTTRIVPPTGPPDANMVFIGEAPGEDEDFRGEPFVGSAGQFQDRCFNQVGIIRSEVLLTNVFWQRPPKNDVTYFYTDGKGTNPACTRYTWEGQEHVDNLKIWLTGLDPRPNLLVAVGRHSMYALTGKKRLWKWRGSILPCTLVEGYKVYITLHPSGVQRLLDEPHDSHLGVAKKEKAINAFPLYLKDLERIKVQGEFPEIEYPKRTYDIDLSFEELCRRLEWLEQKPLISCDIETLPKGPEGPIVWCVGFSPSPDYGFVVPFLRNWRFAWPLPQEAHLIKLISNIFLNENLRKIFQMGAQYDLPILARYFGLRLGDRTYEDTAWCHHAAYPQIKKALETLVSIYTWEPYYKDEGKVNYGKRSGDSAEFTYNAKDCCVTREIFPILEKQAKEMQVWKGYRDSMRRSASLVYMSVHGVKADLEMKQKLQVDFKARADFHHKKLCEREKEFININSPKQLCALLYYKHQLKEQRKRNKARTLTTDKDALFKLKRLYPKNMSLIDIIEHKKFAKLHSTYAEMNISQDARIRTTYGFVTTWRLFSKKSPFDDGGNLQNIPARTEEGRLVRQLFVTDDCEVLPPEEWERVKKEVAEVSRGKVTPINGKKIWVKRDASQAEARYVVWEAEDFPTMELFLDGSIDVHWVRTKDIFNIDPRMPYDKHAEIKVPLIGRSITMGELRDIGKTGKHAGNYGMGTFMFLTILARQDIILPYGTANKILLRTVQSDPFLKAWQNGIREELKANRMLETPLGRRRYFLHSRLNEALFRVGFAFRPQSTVGELLEEGIQGVYENYPYIDVLLNVHDEIDYQVAPKDFKRSLIDTDKELLIPLEIRGRELIIPFETKAGENWGELHEFHPNLGGSS